MDQRYIYVCNDSLVFFVTFAYMVDLVGYSGGGLEVPGDERAVGGVSAHAVGARYEVRTTSQEQDVQGLLDAGFVHVHHLEQTHAHKHAVHSHA